MNALEGHDEVLRSILHDLRDLLSRIDHDIPLLQLAIAASGESLATSLPPSVSPSRLLQASTLLIVGDTQYANATSAIQIGPSFTLSVYMLFLGHAATRLETTTITKGDNNSPPAPLARPSPEEEDRPYGFGEHDRKPIWQEVIHKSRVRLCRTPIHYVFNPEEGYVPCAEHRTSTRNDPSPHFLTEDFLYHLEIIEDLDDERVHDSALNGPYDTVASAGRRVSIPVHHLSKIFYTDTGRILNVGNGLEGETSPVLLLKRDTDPDMPPRMVERFEAYASQREDELLKTSPITSQSSNVQTAGTGVDDPEGNRVYAKSYMPVDLARTSWGLPAHLDPEWIAFEVFEEDDSASSDPDEDSDSDQQIQPTSRKGKPPLDPEVIGQIQRLSAMSLSHGLPQETVTRPSSSEGVGDQQVSNQESIVARSPFGAITSSLSLLEMLIRLSGLQEFQQACHLSIPDHILTFFLEETSTTGLVGKERWDARDGAKRSLGFDPYTDSPGR